MDSASLISLVLLGQPDLAHKLRFAPYEALHQRIAVRFHLKPFDLEETAGYVKHHLRIAGCQSPIFSDSFPGWCLRPHQGRGSQDQQPLSRRPSPGCH